MAALSGEMPVVSSLTPLSRCVISCDSRFTDGQLRETRTGKGATCPTLLHYLAKVLLRTDPRLVLFHEDLPSLEAVARCTFLLQRKADKQ